MGQRIYQCTVAALDLGHVVASGLPLAPAEVAAEVAAAEVAAVVAEGQLERLLVVVP